MVDLVRPRVGRCGSGSCEGYFGLDLFIVLPAVELLEYAASGATNSEFLHTNCLAELPSERPAAPAQLSAGSLAPSVKVAFWSAKLLLFLRDVR
jgi:hypothetical protein